MPYILRAIVCYLAFAFVVGAFLGCAMAYKKPCEFTIYGVLDTIEGVNERCHKMRASDHYGHVTDGDTKILGCAGRENMVVTDSQQTFLHEFQHILDKNCMEAAR